MLTADSAADRRCRSVDPHRRAGGRGGDCLGLPTLRAKYHYITVTWRVAGPSRLGPDPRLCLKKARNRVKGRERARTRSMYENGIYGQSESENSWSAASGSSGGGLLRPWVGRGRSRFVGRGNSGLLLEPGLLLDQRLPGLRQVSGAGSEQNCIRRLCSGPRGLGREYSGPDQLRESSRAEWWTRCCGTRWQRIRWTR